MTKERLYKIADTTALVGSAIYFAVWFSIFGFAAIQTLRGRL